MDSVIEEFKGRAAEVDAYFAFLENTLGPEACTRPTRDAPDKPIPSETQMVLKAAAFLVLYNAVEATVRSAVAEVYSALIKKAVTFEKARDEIRRLYIGIEFGKRFPGDVAASFEGYRSHALTLVNRAIQREVLQMEVLGRGWGNLDAQQIRVLCERHGIDLGAAEELPGGGSVRTVKERRNHLAHGEFTFSEVGRDYSIKDLHRIKKEVYDFISKVLDRFRRFVDGAKYLRPIPPAAQEAAPT